MSERQLVVFRLTRDDFPAEPGFDPHRETPYSAAMENEDLRVESDGDGCRFLRTVILACQMLEKANPGKLAIMVDHDIDNHGHVVALTITVI